MINLENLKDLRQDNDINQEKMAKILNVKRDALAKWESGVNLPPFEVIYNFAKYFEYSIDYVLGLNYDRTKIQYDEYNKFKMADNLKSLRVGSNLTYRALAEKLGVSHPAIIRYEQCKSKPSINVLYKYCKAFNISFTDLCNGFIKK